MNIWKTLLTRYNAKPTKQECVFVCVVVDVCY